MMFSIIALIWFLLLLLILWLSDIELRFHGTESIYDVTFTLRIILSGVFIAGIVRYGMILLQ